MSSNVVKSLESQKIPRVIFFRLRKQGVGFMLLRAAKATYEALESR
jgi:hypothetical protein